MIRVLSRDEDDFRLASFIRVVGSEFVQKYLGEGPRMVRDVFRLAKGIFIPSSSFEIVIVVS